MEKWISWINSSGNKKGIDIAKRMSETRLYPPHVIEFYDYSKGIRTPAIPKLKK